MCHPHLKGGVRALDGQGLGVQDPSHVVLVQSVPGREVHIRAAQGRGAGQSLGESRDRESVPGLADPGPDGPDHDVVSRAQGPSAGLAAGVALEGDPEVERTRRTGGVTKTKMIRRARATRRVAETAMVARRADTGLGRATRNGMTESPERTPALVAGGEAEVGVAAAEEEAAREAEIAERRADPEQAPGHAGAMTRHRLPVTRRV